jgi:spermidine synthase
VKCSVDRTCELVTDALLRNGWVVVRRHRSRFRSTYLHAEARRQGKRVVVRVSKHAPRPEFEGISISPGAWTLERFRHWVNTG